MRNLVMNMDEKSSYKINCPVCGRLSKYDIEIYNRKLRKQNFKHSPIVPACRICKSEVSITSSLTDVQVIIINGTCGSGKSSIAEWMEERYNYKAIDGDCVMQVVKHKLNPAKTEYNLDEVLSEIMYEIEILSLYSQNIVLSHIILPEDINRYINLFESKKIRYKFILLKPDFDTALNRCQTRTCHKHITPEYWVRYFYDRLNFSDEIHVIDNTVLTIPETVNQILDIVD
jgi:gluconate kinase